MPDRVQPPCNHLFSYALGSTRWKRRSALQAEILMFTCSHSRQGSTSPTVTTPHVRAEFYDALSVAVRRYRSFYHPTEHKTRPVALVALALLDVATDTDQDMIVPNELQPFASDFNWIA